MSLDEMMSQLYGVPVSALSKGGAVNERNVDALAAAFGGAFFKVCGGALDPQELRDLAREVIATHGVLVPSVMTLGDRIDLRLALERIARGET